MTTYNVEPETLAAPEHPEEPRSVEIFADMRAPAPVVPSIGLIPEVASSTPPATLGLH